MSTVLLGILLLTALLLLLSLTVLAARRVLSPALPVQLTVNRTRQIPAVTGQKLLSALADNGVLIPSACAGAGTCGLCRVQVTEGNEPALPTEAARLTAAELRQGMHLACQVVLRHDMGLEVDEALLGAESYEAEILSSRPLSPLIREIVLQLPPGERPEIYAGSFVQVTTPPFSLSFADIDVPGEHRAAWETLRALSVESDDPVTRAYSISDRPEDIAAGRVVLNVRVALPPPSVPGAPPGVVSSWLFARKPGDRVELSGPFGAVRVQENDREMVFIGGGVGMAPLRAMIWEQLESRGTDRPMSFWYGARSMADLFYADEFDALAAKHPNFGWTVALSDPAPDTTWTGPVGFVHNVVLDRHLRDHPAPEECDYYLCGPPLMIRAVLAMLDDLGVPRERIFNDDFGV